MQSGMSQRSSAGILFIMAAPVAESTRPIEVLLPVSAGASLALLVALTGYGPLALQAVAAAALGFLFKRLPFRIGFLLIAPMAIPAIIVSATRSPVLLALAAVASVAAGLFLGLLAAGGMIATGNGTLRITPED